MNCQDFREMTDSYLCGELLTETNHEVLRHLENCAKCCGVIETRRILRSKIKCAVENAPQFQIREDFCKSLRLQLKHTAIAAETIEKPVWTVNISLAALAASLIFAVSVGFWLFRSPPENIFPTEVSQKIHPPEMSLANFAVGDHQNCAVKFNLDEKPIAINLASAKYAGLRQSVLLPLQNSTDKYEFLESHNCKFEGHNFTHLVFRHQGKTVSILLTDLQNYPALKENEIAEMTSNGYQIARFDIKDRAVFIISDLSEPENLATANILESSFKQKFLGNEQAAIISIKR